MKKTLNHAQPVRALLTLELRLPHLNRVAVSFAQINAVKIWLNVRAAARDYANFI
jgi:hypothetical protein